MHFYQFFTIFYSLLQIWRGRNDPASDKVEEAEAAQVEEVEVELWVAGEAEEQQQRVHGLLQPAHLDAVDQEQPNNNKAAATTDNKENAAKDYSASKDNPAAEKSMKKSLIIIAVYFCMSVSVCVFVCDCVHP